MLLTENRATQIDSSSGFLMSVPSPSHDAQVNLPLNERNDAKILVIIYLYLAYRFPRKDQQM